MRYLNLWVALGLVFVPTSASFAQTGSYNPYALDAGTPASEAVWPAFYKPPAVTPKEAYRYEMGWCRWYPGKYKYDPNNLIDVNKLPKAVVSGRVAAVHDGALTLVDETNATKIVVIHDDPAISAVQVKGSATPAALRRGQFVQFQGAIDAKGHVTEPIAALELIPQPKPGSVPEVVAGKPTVIIAQVTTHQNGRLTMTVSAGKLRSLSGQLDEHAQLTVAANDYKLAGVEDKVTVTGRLYQAEPDAAVNVNAVAVDNLFALEVEIELAHPLGETAKEPTVKAAAR